MEKSGARRKSYLRHFLFIPLLLVFQSHGKLVVSNRSAGSNMKLIVGHAFSGLLFHCCVYENTETRRILCLVTSVSSSEGVQRGSVTMLLIL